MMRSNGFLVLILGIILFFVSCKENYTPKPRGYFRIDLPGKEYQKYYSDSLPYSFEYPVYARISKDPLSPEQKYWINIDFPKLNATVYISYRQVTDNLDTLINDGHLLVSKHISKADAIYDSTIYDPSRKVYGTVFDIEGIGVASTYQFYLTDSTKHYLRGALYFDTYPNNDSLKPVINFLKKDINRFISTLQWK